MSYLNTIWNGNGQILRKLLTYWDAVAQKQQFAALLSHCRYWTDSLVKLLNGFQAPNGWRTRYDCYLSHAHRTQCPIRDCHIPRTRIFVAWTYVDNVFRLLQCIDFDLGPLYHKHQLMHFHCYALVKFQDSLPCFLDQAGEMWRMDKCLPSIRECVPRPHPDLDSNHPFAAEAAAVVTYEQWRSTVPVR